MAEGLRQRELPPEGVIKALLGSLWLLATIVACSSPQPSGFELSFQEQWRQRLPAILEEASDSQVAILSDGEITRAEHDRALLAFLGCIEDAGARVLEKDLDDSGLLQMLSVVGPTTDSDPDPIVSECKQQHYLYIEEAWRIAELPTGETQSSQFARIAECMAKSGFEIPSDPKNFGEMVTSAERLGDDARTRLLSCSDEVQ